jgi:serine/threonine protein kinase
MAAVWRAQDLQLDRTVAVKVFSAGEASDTARREAEAQTLARLNHPNLVTLLDAHLAAAGSDEPSYIVMELVEGPSLRDELDRGPLPAEEVAVLAAELAEALVAVHAAGIVHRDLKPANILLTLTGLPSQPYRGKLADFGIAHLVGSDRITTDGIVVGTAAYLSPEQARGVEPGPASDIYALGLIVLECLTGEPPFTGTAAESVGARLLRDPDIPAGLPVAWSQLLREMTARDAVARPDAIAVAIRARETVHDLVGWTPAVPGAPATVRIGQATPVDAPTVPMPADATDSVPVPVPALVPEDALSAPGRARRRIIAIGSAAAAALVAIVVAVALTTSGGEKQIVQTPNPSDSATVAPVSTTEPTSGSSPAPPPSSTPEPSATEPSAPEPSATEQPAAPSPATSDGNSGNNGNNGNGNGNGKPKKNK